MRRQTARSLSDLTKHGPENIRTLLKVAGAKAIPDFRDLHLGHEPKTLSKLGHDRRARGGDQLVRFINLPDRNALQYLERRRRRNRKRPVRALDGPMPVVQGGNKHLPHPERLDAGARENDVRDRVEGTHFVEMDVLRAHAVNLSLGYRDPVKDGKGMIPDKTGKVAVVDQITNLAVGATVRMTVVVMFITVTVRLFTVVVFIGMGMGVL